MRQQMIKLLKIICNMKQIIKKYLITGKILLCVSLPIFAKIPTSGKNTYCTIYILYVYLYNCITNRCWQF